VISLDDLDPRLMMDPGLNAIIAKSNTHIVTSKKIMRHRLSLGSTPFYHTVLDKLLEKATVVTIHRGKPTYPEENYLGNVIMKYLPERHAWKITITNGGLKRKNAKLPLKIMEVFYLRKTMGSYWVDDEFEEDDRE